MKTIVVMPAYNEGDRIVEAINDASRFVDAVVVVDDGSHDQTAERAGSAGAIVLRHAINRGQGAALQTGMDYALQKLEAEVIVHFDADGQMRGEEILPLAFAIQNGEADVVLGSRFLGSTEHMPPFRRLILKLAIAFTFLTVGLWLTDTHNGFRALSQKAAKKIRLRQNKMAHATEILEQIAAQKFRVREHPVTIRYTKATLAKGQKSSALFRVAWDVLRQKLMN